jgi:uracil-DNA glycosylase family 4
VSHRCKPASCLGCALHDHGNDFSAVEGTGANGCLLVGEASGEHEQRDQAPFRSYAPAGAVLERCLRRMGLDRQQFAITNCIRCRPRHNFLENAPWEFAALRHCRPNLDQAIADYRPRCIVSLGGVALRELTGEAGEARGVTHLAGYCLPLAATRVPCDNCISHDSLDVPRNQRMTDATCDQCHGSGYVSGAGVIPTIANFHPSYLRRGKASHQGVFSRIIQRGLAIASGRDRAYMWGVDPDDPATWRQPSGERLQYWTRPTLDQCRSVLAYLRANPNLWIAKDIETSESSSLDEDAREGFSDTEVRLFQLSYQPGTGIAIPYTGEFKQVIHEMIHLPNPFYGHNWDNFDHKVLRAAAAREGWTYAPTQRCYDTLDMFHHWQPDLPAHLQFCSSFINFPFPWKHLAATDIEFYGICDVDADLRLGQFLATTLKKDNLWGEGDAYSLTLGYTGQEREVRPVLAAMEDRGVPIDDAARLRLGAEFEAAQRELGKELAERAPVECQRVHPKDGYKGLPPEVKKWATEHGWDLLYQGPAALATRLSIVKFQDPLTTAKDGTIEDGEWYSYQRKTFTITEAMIHPTTLEPTTSSANVERWCRVYDFNPNSSQQLIAYMKSKGHRVPKSKIEDEEGNQKDTTAAKELQRLAVKTGDDFYLKVIEYRGLTKLRGTYVDGFKPGADGRVHTTFTFQTAIAQLSARNPNTTNFPKLKPTPALAKAIRGMICADEGHVLAEVDFKSCHVITLGLLAGDENYTRLGRLDIHSFVAGHVLNLWDGEKIFGETDEQLLARFKWLKSDSDRKRVRDDQSKRTILGIGNGLSAKGLWERFMEYFPARDCPDCAGTGKVQGLRGLKACPKCKGTAKQSGLQIAEEILSTCRRLFPKVFEYQELQRKEAHETQRLRTPFGHQRRFYEVYRWDGKKGAWGHGDQAEEAVAYRLANTAHAHMREVMKDMYRTELDCKYSLFNMVHDSLLWHFPEALLQEFTAEVLPVMMAPSRVMPGLWLGVEASYGRRWSDMREVTLPSTLTPLATMAVGGHVTQGVAL